MNRNTMLVGLLLTLSACGGGGGSSGKGEGPPPSPSISMGFVAPSAAKTVMIDGVEYVVADREVLVGLVEDVTPAQYDAVIERLKSLDVSAINTRLEIRVLQVVVGASGGELAIIDAMRVLPGVDFVDFNYAESATRANTPGARSLTARPALSGAKSLAADVTADYWVDRIDLNSAWQVEDELHVQTGPMVAVIDSGLAIDPA